MSHAEEASLQARQYRYWSLYAARLCWRGEPTDSKEIQMDWRYSARLLRDDEMKIRLGGRHYARTWNRNVRPLYAKKFHLAGLSSGARHSKMRSAVTRLDSVTVRVDGPKPEYVQL